MNLKLHTILLLVGPSGSGKSYFTKNFLIPKLENSNIGYISSDEIRQNLLSNQFTKYNNQMLEVSEQAFNILFNLVDNYTSYPVNKEFVIVDTTGLDPLFRNKILDIAKKNNYNLDIILFDYKDKDDYFKYLTENELKNKHIIHKHIRKLKDNLFNIRKNISNIYKIKSKDDFQNIDINIENLDYYKQCFLPNSKENIIIGDVHSCIEELIELLRKNSIEIDNNLNIIDTKNKNIIFVGDIIDKNNLDNTLKTIDFFYKNKNKLNIVLGNHEQRLYDLLFIKDNTHYHIRTNTQEKLQENKIFKNGKTYQEWIDTYYNTYKFIKDNNEYKNKLLEILKIIKPFFIYKGNEYQKSFIVTHSPAKNKYLGKIDKNSIKQMQETVEIKHLLEENISNYPYHIFGHLALEHYKNKGNKFAIDTGCIYGNYLTSLILPYKKYKTVKSNCIPKSFKEWNIFKKEYNIEDLEEKDKKRLNFLIKNKIDFIGGTISPADKLENNLEDIKTVLDYYKSMNIEEIVLQPKYMGSRCQVYLYKDIEKCYATSRNGYLINNNIMKDIYKDLQYLLDKYNTSFLLLDGELMPWHTLGKGLINETFKSINIGIKNELDFLSNNDFEEKLNLLNKEIEDLNIDFNKNKKELEKELGYKSNTYIVYNQTKNKLVPLNVLKEKWNVYNKQIDIYTKNDKPYFKPFAILKDDNGIVNFKPERFNEINNDKIKIVNLQKETALKEAKEFFESLWHNNMEGIVVKPNIEKIPNILVPYFKVRNPEYLTLIYGYDYTIPFRYEKLIENKKINKKVALSKKEYQINQKILATNDIKEKEKLFIELLFTIKEEDTLDPRL